MNKWTVRLAAGALATLTVFTACDGVPIAGPGAGPDGVPPRIDLTLVSPAGVTGNQIPVGSAVVIGVTASDDMSLKTVSVAARRDTTKIVSGAPVRDSVVYRKSTTFTAATPSYSDTLGVPLTGAAGGDTIRVYAAASDGNGNVAIDTIFFILVDSTKPFVKLDFPTTAVRIKPASTDSIRVSAADSGGIATIGYQILPAPASGAALDTNSVCTRSVALARPKTVTKAFVPDFCGIRPAQYLVRGFAVDGANLRGYTDTVRIGIIDTVKPELRIVQPLLNSTIPRGSELRYMEVVAADSIALTRVTIKGIVIRGDPIFDPSVDTLVVYDSVPKVYPASPPTLRDSIVRTMKPSSTPLLASDTVVYFVATAIDESGNVTTTSVRTRWVTGPIVRLFADTVAWVNRDLSVRTVAVDRPEGIGTLNYTVSGTGTGLPFTTTLVPTAENPAGADSVDVVTRFTIPADAPVGSIISITPASTDQGGQEGTGARLAVRIISEPRDSLGPLVYQTVTRRLEMGGTISLDAHDPSRIRKVGYVMRSNDDPTRIILQDSLVIPVGSERGDTVVTFKINYPRNYRGRGGYFYGFAEDTLGNRGYTLFTGNTVPQLDSTKAKRDSTLMVYGVTYPLPTGSLGADIAVDTLRKRAFISNVLSNYVAVWSDSAGITANGATAATRGFSTRTVLVGSQPFGMTLTASGDTLLVANSGGTNISIVDLLPATGPAELQTRRIQTPNTQVYSVPWSQDQVTKVIRYGLVERIDYSDRPQFLAISANGNLYFSTRPTSAAPQGTLRRIEAALSTAPKLRQIWQYAPRSPTMYSVFHADSVFKVVALSTTESDSVMICDTPAAGGGSVCVTRLYPTDAANFLRATYNADVEVAPINAVDVALRDTNFVSAGGDRRRIVFGEGATSGKPGRVFTALDTAGMHTDSARYSPDVSIQDLTNNASDVVFGVAMNRNSTLVGVHGSATFFADSTLRLQGTYNSFGSGAGLIFHPDNTGDNSPGTAASLFVASADTSITAVHTYNWYQRGSFPIKTNIYGSIRAVRHFHPATGYTMLLVGLSRNGLVVIDLQDCDIDNQDPALRCPLP